MKRILTTLASKWPEYLLEILVITIGILGAFALNNWNENRIAKARELELLSNLRGDFINRLEELRDIQSVRIRMVDAIDSLAILANNPPEDFEKTQMDRLLSYLYISYRFNDEFRSLDMLFSSDGINLLSNEELKDQLIRWPWLVQEMLEEQDRIENQLLDLKKAMSNYVAANDLLAQFPIRDISSPLEKGYFKSDYGGLLKDRKLMDMITHKRSYLYFNIRDGAELISLGEKIILLMDKQLIAE